MFNVIDFLERVGQDARLRYASRSEIALDSSAIGLDPDMKEALLGRDQPMLESILVQGTFYCMQFPAREDEEREEEDEGGDEPSRHDEEAAFHRPVRVLSTAD